MTGSATSGTTVDAVDTEPGTQDLFTLLIATSQLLTDKFPKKHGAFERVVQLAEETGEVAEQINIWAGTGLKREKHGEFVPQNLATELADVMRVAAGIAVELNIVDLLGYEIRSQHARAAGEGRSS
ncbi:hypothetical protein ACGFJ7_35465 [Actinoplanes sp. NPDC048988]|uniref:hypothetical protein n=1 Tax=Actinoplanes sp. NPDC048988 TaxID=3363901 RepID=UPI003721D039